jgi:alcohol dehydrogenase (cytochrome c)
MGLSGLAARSTGKTLWHATVAANRANGAITYELDGKQYVVVGAGDSLFAFALVANH